MQLGRERSRNELFTKEEMCSAFSRLNGYSSQDGKHNTSINWCLLIFSSGLFLSSGNKNIQIWHLGKKSLIWSTKILAGGMHGIA
jgi:hypothetical protein